VQVGWVTLQTQSARSRVVPGGQTAKQMLLQQLPAQRATSQAQVP
jgi:hypothetical protein